MVYPQNKAVEKVVFRENFRNAVSVAKNNGTLNGNPTFTGKGIDLDGSSDYVSYAITSSFFNMAKISIVIEFTPDFNYDDDVLHVLYSSTVGKNYVCYKAGSGGSNKLYILLGNTEIAKLLIAAYSAYWKQNERNVLVISGTSGATSAWLNGNQILTDDTTIWGPTTPTEFCAGATVAGASKFDGEIHSVSIYNDLLTAEDAQALYDRSLFRFKNLADVWLDMKSQVGVGTAGDPFKTKDKSGKGNDFLLGTGQANYPDFVNPGFDLVRANSDYLSKTNASDFYNNAKQTIVMCFKPDFTTDANLYYYFFDTTQNYRYAIIKEHNASNNVLDILMGDTLIAAIAETTYKPYWNVYGLNVIIMSGTTGNTDVWLNGFKILDANSTAWSPVNPSEIYIGIRYGNVNHFDGKIFHFSTYDFKFSPTMMRNITNYLFREYSNG